MGDHDALTIAEVVGQNVARSARWHPPESEQWTGADWSNAMQGEAGEAGNVVKKLRRIETMPERYDPILMDEAGLRRHLGDELADTVLYLVLVANHYDIDLPAAIVAKFNRVSELEGFPERLPAVQCGPCQRGFHRMCRHDGCGCRRSDRHREPAATDG